jgi:uncharacterized protein YcgL (UPF0745 family)
MPATSAATFPNVTVYISRVTSCDVTQLLVVPRSLARPKVLLLGNLVGEELLLKNEIKKVKKSILSQFSFVLNIFERTSNIVRHFHNLR